MFAECPGTLHASYTWFFGPMNVRGIYRICILLRTDETSSSITVSTTQCMCVWNRLQKDANEGRHFDYQSIFFYRISCNGPIQNDSMACDMFVYFTSMGWNVANEHSHPLTASIPPLTHSLTHSAAESFIFSFSNYPVAMRCNIAAHLFRLLVLWSIVLGFQNW